MQEQIPLSALQSSRLNRRIDPEHMRELAASMRDAGLWEAVMVREIADGAFQVIAGHHRVEAARSLGWTEIRAERWVMDDETADATVIDSNLKHKALTPGEEAEAIQGMIDRHGWTQGQAAEKFARSQKWVSERLSLLKLAPTVLDFIPQGKLDAAHAVHISRAPAEVQEQVARLVVDGDLNKGATEALVKLAGSHEAPAEVRQSALAGKVAPQVAAAIAQAKDRTTRQGLLVDAERGMVTEEEAHRAVAASNRRLEAPKSLKGYKAQRRISVTKHLEAAKQALEAVEPVDMYDLGREDLDAVEQALRSLGAKMDRLGAWVAAARSKPVNGQAGGGKVRQLHGERH